MMSISSSCLLGNRLCTSNEKKKSMQESLGAYMYADTHTKLNNLHHTHTKQIIISKG